MTQMTSYERFKRMFEHREADRVPIIDGPWQGTIARWHREGMPEGVDWRDYFAVDKLERVGIDISPRYEAKVIEDAADYTIYTSPWGVTMKQFKEMDSTPEFLDFTVTTPEAWEQAKARMTPQRDRVNWQYLEENYPKWRAEGRWVEAGFWFGFDVTHSWMVGTETLLVAMMEEPEWVKDMFNHYLDMSIAQFDMMWDAGYRFDAIHWYDDMGYKHTPFFSPRMYRELLQPYHKRACEWAHAKGIYTHLHSCGFIQPLLEDVLAAGVDCLNPLEVKAGMEPLALKAQYGDRLVLHGGVNAVLWDHKDQIIAEIEQVVPALKQNGGFIFSSDHSIPHSVSLENFQAIVNKVKELGTY